VGLSVKYNTDGGIEFAEGRRLAVGGWLWRSNVFKSIKSCPPSGRARLIPDACGRSNPGGEGFARVFVAWYSVTRTPLLLLPPARDSSRREESLENFHLYHYSVHGRTVFQFIVNNL